jgi:hypothetical protein
MSPERIEQEIIFHAIVDGINTFVREILVPRCPALKPIWDEPPPFDLDRLKYEVAATIAANWAVSKFAEEE